MHLKNRCKLICVLMPLLHAQLNFCQAQDSGESDSLDVSGRWVTNQGLLELTQEGVNLEGTLSAIPVNGTVEQQTIHLSYKRNRSETVVTLEVDPQGWVAGKSETGRSKVTWYGCRDSQPTISDAPTDFSGHWLLSWGILQLTQDGGQVTGAYGADQYGKVEGSVSGRRLALQWKRHGRKGKAWIEQSPDGTQLIGTTVGTEKPAVVNGVRASGYSRMPTPVAGETVRGIAKNGMLYHLRMPEDWTAESKPDVIVLFHGSNFTTAGMVHVVASKWPEIAKRFAILGIQGERWAKWSSAKDLRFNYSYASWVGRSTYKGFPYTDRESPKLVMDVIQELDDEHAFERVFAGGHSQGGFLTYMLHMHFPERLAGTFPIAGGIPFQSEPNAFDDEKLIAEQRQTPMLILHGKRDGVVRMSASTYAYSQFLNHGYSRAKLVNPNAGHPFDFLPVGEAIEWLDVVTTGEVDKLKAWAAEQVQQSNWRDVGVAVIRARELKAEDDLAESIDAFESAAKKDADQHLAAIEADKDGAWVDPFLSWQDQFSVADAAGPANEAFAKLREKHSEKANKLQSQAKKAFRSKQTDEGWKLYQEIVETLYAAPQYRTLVESVRKHFAKS